MGKAPSPPWREKVPHCQLLRTTSCQPCESKLFRACPVHSLGDHASLYPLLSSLHSQQTLTVCFSFSWSLVSVGPAQYVYWYQGLSDHGYMEYRRGGMGLMIQARTGLLPNLINSVTFGKVHGLTKSQFPYLLS